MLEVVVYQNLLTLMYFFPLYVVIGAIVEWCISQEGNNFHSEGSEES